MTRFRLLLSVVFAAVSLGAQAQTTVADKWTAPRTPDGHPDLQGIWTTQTYTPLQRPERYAGREFLTDDEAAELTRLLTQDGVDPLAGNIFGASDEERDKRIHQTDKTHYNNADWLTTSQPKALSSRRTSLIVDPPDGRIPPLTPEGQRRNAARRAAAGFDSYENLPIQQRCIIWTHEGPPMLPPPYNDVYQIVQAPAYVVVVREVAGQQTRIIPTDGRPHVSGQVRQWGGDSRGHWEGDTLVVETTNFKEEAAIQGSSASLRVIERFRRVSADRILYQFTVEDPTTWTKPWSAEIPMTKTDGPVYEYACHEGNYSLENTLRGARVREKKAAEGTAQRDQK
jgi:hypothetical protein